jgi:hypothetical protein
MAKKSQRLRRQRRIERMKTNEQEAKMAKVVDDNSVVIERMKNVSSACDTILQTIDNMQTTTEPISAAIIEPQFMSVEPIPELEEEQMETPDLKRMLKKDLLNLASEVGLNLKASTTKTKIIKAINEVQ